MRGRWPIPRRVETGCPGPLPPPLHRPGGRIIHPQFGVAPVETNSYPRHGRRVLRFGVMARYSVSAVPRLSALRRTAPYGEPESLQLPGCRPVRISRDAMADYEGRIEYWDANTEVAMVCEPVSIYHEHPPQRLAGLLKTIAHVRGSPIETFGAADLLVRDAHGAHLRIMQADQTVYLRPRATRPWGPAIEVGSDVLPDVVLEVDSKILTCHGVPPCFNK